MARTAAWLLGLVVFVVAPSLRADDASVPVRLELDGPFGCVSGRELLGALQSRNGRVRLAAGDESALLLRVRVTEAAHALHGQLELITEDGARSSRSVEGDSCKAVVDALALTAALALQLAAESPSSPATAAVPTVVARDAGARIRPSSPRKKAVHFELGAQAAVAQMVTPHLNVGGNLLGRARLDRGLESSFSVALLHTRNELFESSRHAALRVTGVSLTACPAQLKLLGGVRLEPCLSGTGAQLEAIGRDLPMTRSVKRSWWGVGGLGRASVSPWQGVALEVEGGALVPLVDRELVVLPSGASLGKTPVLAPFANVGVSYAL
jgi:hypothetical protein